ncbi:1831_t:CDS:2, partial [Racocetra persica]
EINEKNDPDTLSSISKGNELEFISFGIFKTMKFDCARVRLSGPYGDGGIDIFGNFKRYLILVQCKNYTDAKVSVDNIRKFEGVISRYPNRTIGIYITFDTDRYSRNATIRAEISKFNILLTNVSSMKPDIINYVFKKLNNAFDDTEECIIDEIICKIKKNLIC